MEFDAFLGELFRFLRRSDTIDRAVLGFSIVHFARFLGEFRADIVGILGEVVVQFLELGAKLLLLRRYHCDRSGGGHRSGDVCGRSRCFNGRALFSCSCRQARRHDCLLDLRRAALRTVHEGALRLLFVRRRILEPAFEFVAAVADECVTYHSAPRTTCKWAGSAIGSTISKRRPCCSDGIRARALATSAGSILAMTIPGSVPPSAMMRPQGSAITEWPYVSRPFSCLPPCAAAKTKQPFSIARARIRMCQCASPVCFVNAE